MSSFEAKHGHALSGSRWLTKVTADHTTYLIQYAHHPERAGYVIIATDLHRVLFESFTAPSVPTRLAEIEALPSYSRSKSKRKRPKPHHTSGEVDVRDAMTRAEEVLKKIGGMMQEWEGVEMEVTEHDFYDDVITLRSQGFIWCFNLTELKGRTPLSFIVDQLVKPLASVLARERGIEFDEGQALLAILADEGIAKEVQAIHGIETKNDRKPRKATIEEEQDYESEPEADDMQEDGDGLVEEEAEDRMKEVSEEDTLNEEEVAPPTPRKLASTRRYANRIESTSASPPPAEPPARSRKKRETSAADDEPSPPKPTPMLTTSQQRSKKEREKEEEEELEKRREEMRKRMGAGGGGRLGKRRFGR